MKRVLLSVALAWAGAAVILAQAPQAQTVPVAARPQTATAAPQGAAVSANTAVSTNTATARAYLKQVPASAATAAGTRCRPTSR